MFSITLSIFQFIAWMFLCFVQIHRMDFDTYLGYNEEEAYEDQYAEEMKMLNDLEGWHKSIKLFWFGSKTLISISHFTGLPKPNTDTSSSSQTHNHSSNESSKKKLFDDAGPSHCSENHLLNNGFENDLIIDEELFETCENNFTFTYQCHIASKSEWSLQCYKSPELFYQGGHMVQGQQLWLAISTLVAFYCQTQISSTSPSPLTCQFSWRWDGYQTWVRVLIIWMTCKVYSTISIMKFADHCYKI